MKSEKAVAAIGIGIAVVGIAVLVHHLAKHGYLVDNNDILNHEFFVGILTSLGAGLMVGGALQS